MPSWVEAKRGRAVNCRQSIPHPSTTSALPWLRTHLYWCLLTMMVVRYGCSKKKFLGFSWSLVIPLGVYLCDAICLLSYDRVTGLGLTLLPRGTSLSVSHFTLLKSDHITWPPSQGACQDEMNCRRSSIAKVQVTGFQNWLQSKSFSAVSENQQMVLDVTRADDGGTRHNLWESKVFGSSWKKCTFKLGGFEVIAKTHEAAFRLYCCTSPCHEHVLTVNSIVGGHLPRCMPGVVK